MDVKSGTVVIKFANINVNYVNNTSAVAIGKNFMSNWTSNLKINSGLGDVSGRDNLIIYSRTAVIDPDYIDSPTYFTQSV